MSFYSILNYYPKQSFLALKANTCRKNLVLHLIVLEIFLTNMFFFCCHFKESTCSFLLTMQSYGL